MSERFKKVSPTKARGYLLFTMNAGFASAFFLFGLIPKADCYAAYPSTLPLDMTTYDPTLPATDVKYWFNLICFGAFIGYVFATLGSIGYCF